MAHFPTFGTPSKEEDEDEEGEGDDEEDEGWRREKVAEASGDGGSRSLLMRQTKRTPPQK